LSCRRGGIPGKKDRKVPADLVATFEQDCHR
jgi:hypothetical protein